ncbi:hypothetical protein PG996_013436 [Apiospora saccharicola]|uniref:Uncharacterized protein n=1 Tax=Apiospora saccharicola TaxID=335842 RepID=A0ABR1U5G4_9PEZI
MPRRSASPVDYYIIAKEYHRVRQHPSPAVTSNHQPLASYSSHSLSHLEASIYSHRQFPSLGRPPLAGSDPPWQRLPPLVHATPSLDGQEVAKDSKAGHDRIAAVANGLGPKMTLRGCSDTIPTMRSVTYVIGNLGDFSAIFTDIPKSSSKPTKGNIASLSLLVDIDTPVNANANANAHFFP